MKGIGIFDILGPIMIGPSSSHTAGAARLGKIARSIAGGDIAEVTFLLHGSFAKTYKGHGTDRALVAGILGMEPSDERLRNSMDIAREKGIKFLFKEADLGDVHPNTVKFVMRTEDDNYCEVMGSSIGGGNIKVCEVNDNEVDFTGMYETLIVSQKDAPGVIHDVTHILYSENINVAFMKVFRDGKGQEATMIFEMDNKVSEETIKKIENLELVHKVISISPAKEE
ncbi:L-serine ammonia-lyase, iron-sulfur-dependent subunit beta [Clostridium sp. SM-530-WT-3G]|uniref:L-serine ammonia-lyase, iron-sulfur-dependent subunit beta n=1 Tax=Clostridium sp. SM-530-WT-3G TaxID=2725303 RepID=UPI00145D68D4|nr:L-serine ammonia-lyase, iron-sulfur-dependent subunit beta [Clostridium sp. SM-530-WT-3G]NME83933.1 L-serine ammonia-lyase, iron-sulfur-dependent, subunit beta [Clostridium sp. SM-530-WT-3G]